MSVALADGVETALIAHARAAAPAECCGLLIGTADTVVETMAARNAADDPTTRYLIDPRDHLRAVRSARQGGLEVIGAYHSHPRSVARPSETDAAEAFAEFLFVIVGLATEPPEVTGWIWTGGNFAAVPLVGFPKG